MQIIKQGVRAFALDVPLDVSHLMGIAEERIRYWGSGRGRKENPDNCDRYLREWELELKELKGEA